MSDPRITYEERRRRFTTDHDREATRARTLSQARLIAFLLLIASGIWAEMRPTDLRLLSAALALVLFVTLVVLHQRTRKRQERASLLVDLNTDGLRRLDRDWEALPRRDAAQPLREHAFAGDLDVFGRPSLAQLLGPVGSPVGAAVLESWLLAAASPEIVRERQEAVRELSSENDLRDTIAAHARPTAAVSAAELDAFLVWAEEPAIMTAHPLWLWSARLLPLATASLITLDALDIGPARLWLLPLLAAAALTFGPGRSIRSAFRRAFAREGMFKGYPELLAALASPPWRAPLLRKLNGELSAGGLSASTQMARLGRMMHLADLRYSAMVYLPVQLLTLWDFHVMARIDEWRRVAGRHVRLWLDAVGQIEALSALAVLAHDHPDWVFAEYSDEQVFQAEQLGHPMLAPGVRIDNDVTVGPPGTFLLVTGSNMSGKSTLLRAIGLNSVLALAGAPACAARLRLPHVSLCTSIHVEDSLTRGVSFFMAQLQRMKAIVSAADEAPEGTPILYLLDEILQGTNSAERRIAATRVIRHLLDSGAIGAVTTHDLELATEPRLTEAAVPVHFRENVHTQNGRALMTFDYKLRPGVATSTNALKLMEIVGLAD